MLSPRSMYLAAEPRLVGAVALVFLAPSVVRPHQRGGVFVHLALAPAVVRLASLVAEVELRLGPVEVADHDIGGSHLQRELEGAEGLVRVAGPLGPPDGDGGTERRLAGRALGA